LYNHTSHACGSAAPVQDSRTLLDTTLGWWAAGRGAGVFRLWPCRCGSMRSTKSLRSCSSLPHLISACARGSHRIVLRLRAGDTQEVATAAAVASTCSVSCPATTARGTAFPHRSLPGHQCRSSQRES